MEDENVTYKAVLAEYAEATRSLHNLERAMQEAQARYRKALEALNAELLR